jgi:hypothetical protein
MLVVESSEGNAPATATPSSEPRWNLRFLLPGGVLVVSLLALGILGWNKHQNSDLFHLGETADWGAEVYEPKAETWRPLDAAETRTLVSQFSRAHDFQPGPNFDCGVTCVNYGSPRYFVRLVSPTRTTLVFGVWASGKLASVWNERPYGTGSRWIEFGGETDQIASVLQSIAERGQVR